MPLPRVTALLAAYNEEDIIAQSVSALVAEGVRVHVIDDGSTDGTVAALDRLVASGRVTVERRPPSENYAWTALLERKEALARTLDADWFIHADADEFRQGPWPGVGLREAIAIVDRLGYSAIDFFMFEFHPTTADPVAPDDVRQRLRHYAPRRDFDRFRISCWKKQAAPVRLAPTGGHEVEFEGRRVFPLRFLLRHYPVRSQAHGERKVFGERRPRFRADERALGWHVQYDGLDRGASFLRDPATLREWDDDRARLEALVDSHTVDDLTRRLENERAARDEIGRRRDELARRLDELLTSRSWRWTEPIRDLLRRLGGGS